MSTHDALLFFDIHNDLIGRNSPHDPIQQPSKVSKRILLTGGAGFIGSVFVRKLVLNYPEYLIVVVDKLDYCSSLNNLRPFLLPPPDDIDQDIHYSQDGPSLSPTTISMTTEPRWSQSTATLHSDGTVPYHKDTTGRKTNPQYPNFVFLEGDITDVEFIDSIMAKYRINTILHLAAQTHVDKSFGQSIEFTQNNVLGTHVLLEAARKYFRATPSQNGQKKMPQGLNHRVDGVEDEDEDNVDNRFVFVSTDEVYGECPFTQPDCREDAPLAPSNPYSATKAAAECMVQAYYKSFKIPIVITRSNNVYGPFQYPEKIFPKFIMSLLYPDSCRTRTKSEAESEGQIENTGGHCYIHGSGQHSRTYLYVADAANALDVIFHRGIIGEVYNIGAGHELSNIELAQNLIHRLVKPWPSTELPNGTTKHGAEKNSKNQYDQDYYSVAKRQERANKHQTECRTCQERVVFVEDRAFNDQRYAVDSSKLIDLGWSPRVGYEEGIVKMSK
ncbi:hypothetical protein FBU30_006744 [Linnemannia zychae]|nr:hypothetical protein FBU30_006744 [Linnemannia zychae]